MSAWKLPLIMAVLMALLNLALLDAARSDEPEPEPEPVPMPCKWYTEKLCLPHDVWIQVVGYEPEEGE